MKLLFVNQTFHPDVAATAQTLTDIAVGLCERGDEVTVVCARRSYLDDVKHPPVEEYRGVRIFRAPAPLLARRSKAGRACSALLCNLSLFIWLLKAPRADRLVTLTSPPLVAWFAHLVARLRRMPLIYLVMDINPEQAVRAGWLRRGSIGERLLVAALRQVLRHAARIIVLDRHMVKVLAAVSPVEERIVVAPLWGGASEPTTAQVEEFRRRPEIEGRRMVMYAGNHSICHPLDTVLSAAEVLRDRDDLRFVFIGGGARTEDVRQFKNEHKLPNIVQLPYLSAEEIPAALCAADLHLVVMGEAFVGIVHPSKIYQILVFGRPFVLIGPQESSVGDLIALHGVGSQVEHGDVGGLVRAIEKAVATPEPAARESAAILTAGRKYEKKASLPRLLDLLDAPVLPSP